MARRKKNGAGPHMKLYKSYMFRTKDPVIDELRTIIQDRFGKLGYKAFSQIEREGGATASCQAAWFFGKTKRPNSCSIEATGRAVGKKRVWVDYKTR